MKKAILCLWVISVALLSAAPLVRAEEGGELVKSVASQAELSEEQAKAVVKAVFSAISQELKEGRPVTIREFGRFYLSDRAARKGRNPKTGKELDIPARRYVRFKAADGLRSQMNAPK